MGLIPGDVVVEMDASGATVSVFGDLDLAGGQRMMDRVLPVLTQRAGLDLTLDLAKVEFCDSSGIAALVRLHGRCTEHGWRLHTVNMQPGVRRVVVDFGGLGDHLDVSDS